MHCSYCQYQADIRGTVHCVECGWGDLPLLPDGVCESCDRWRRGDRPMPDLDAAASMFTAIVERARQDEESVKNRQASVVTPNYCDVDGCDDWLFVCGGQYVDAIRQHTEQTEGDLIDTLLLVARIANDSAPTPLAA